MDEAEFARQYAEVKRMLESGQMRFITTRKDPTKDHMQPVKKAVLLPPD